MAWNDKPTDAQICALIREYKDMLYGRGLDYPPEPIREAVKLIETRKEMSEEFNAVAHDYIKSERAKNILRNIIER